MKKIKFVFVLAVVLMLSTQCNKDEDKDTTAPIITLNGSNPLMVNKGSTFVDPGAVAIDDTDGDISSNIVVSGQVDTNIEGTYLLDYNVIDAAGNAAERKQREVKVMIF